MKKLLSTKKWLAGLIVLVIALLGIGITIPVVAQTGNGAVNAYSGVYLDSPTLVRLAGVLGLTPAELGNQLQTGKTLAKIAQEKNIPTTTLVEAIVAPYAEQVTLQVKYGYILQERADTLLKTARQRASIMLERDLSGRGEYGNYSWEEMAEQCGYMMNSGMMGNYGGAAGYGGMMGPGMMGGWGGYYNNPATTPGTNSTTTPGGTGFLRRVWNGGRGWGAGGGMMGGGMMGGWGR